MMSEAWVIRPFNGVFLAFFGVFMLLLITASLMVRGKSDRTKRTVIVVACVLFDIMRRQGLIGKKKSA